MSEWISISGTNKIVHKKEIASEVTCDERQTHRWLKIENNFFLSSLLSDSGQLPGWLNLPRQLPSWQTKQSTKHIDNFENDETDSFVDVCLAKSGIFSRLCFQSRPHFSNIFFGQFFFRNGLKWRKNWSNYFLSRIKVQYRDHSRTICSCFSCCSIWDEHSCTLV